MLDTDTRRRIDTARDILVGKIPDPKAQVEQITIALIYKFMDDMDAGSEELGGKRKFFTGDFSRYGWAKLMRSGLGGHETLGLYMEAIAKIPENPGIPLLFRDIFKNAFLPYHDPETLKSFLKIIDEFTYDHSERLGDAFEYLLSVLGSQGDAGQFRTPRHIIDFMVAILDPKKNETILDPACGTAGFLISSYKHILKTNADDKGQSKLTPDEKGKLAGNFKGYDISPDMVRLSLVNLYLHGFIDPRIEEYDTLTSEDKWNELADVILANPPFMSPRGGIKPHKRFSVQSKRSEVLFVDYMAEHLTPNGRAGIVVPEGIIFQTGTAYKALRKKLIEECLVGVISLPTGVFQPYSGVKTSILILDKELNQKTDSIFFAKVENDGFSLGAQRTVINKNDLPEITKVISKFLEEPNPSVDEIANLTIQKKSKILENPNLPLTFVKEISSTFDSDFDLVRLDEIADIIGGGTPSRKNVGYWQPASIKWITCKHLDDEGKISSWEPISEKGLNESSATLVRKESTIVVSRVSVGKVNWLDDDYAINQDLTGLTVKDKNAVSPKYLFFMVRSLGGHVKDSAQGLGVTGVTRGFIKSLKIPLPSIEVQQEIVKELEGYQKIIDGCRQVVENYKPTIDIDPSWEMVELNKAVQVNPRKSEVQDLDDEMQVSFVPMEDLNENQITFNTPKTKALGEVYSGYTYFRDDDVLLAKVTPCFENGKSGIARSLVNGIGFGSSEYYVLRSTDKVLPEWIYIITSTHQFRKNGVANFTGTSGLRRVPKSFVEGYKIPVPAIQEQKFQIDRVMSEIEVVDGNKKLIEIYTQKIQDRISKVWGED